MSEPINDIAARLDAALILFLKSYFWSNQPAGRASVVPGFAAVTVNVLACFEGGKQAFQE